MARGFGEDVARIAFGLMGLGLKQGQDVSIMLEGETFAMALGKIYTFGPTFRAENSNTSRHLAEFWMIEPEMAFFCSASVINAVKTR